MGGGCWVLGGGLCLVVYLPVKVGLTQARQHQLHVRLDLQADGVVLLPLPARTLGRPVLYLHQDP